MKNNKYGYCFAEKRNETNDNRNNIAKSGGTFISDLLQPFHDMMQNK